MKKVSTSLTKRIEEINELIRQCNELELTAYTYGGGTHEHYVNLKPIVVKNQFVTIETSSPSMYDFISKERFNVTKDEFWDDNGIEALKWNLHHIKKALVNAIKNN
jgi:mannosyltransferase OCH1-like enzyme